MTLRPTDASVAARREVITDAEEEKTLAVASRVVRRFLRRALAATRESLGIEASSLSAAGLATPSDPFSLGAARQWWDESLDAELLPRLREVYSAGWSDASTLLVSSAEAASYLARVRDRLSSTATPGLPDDAFNIVRQALVEELSRGASIPRISQRLAAELSWDDPAAYWRKRKLAAQSEIDAILDPLGSPGSPARELAKRSDPRVIELRRISNEATAKIDAVESTWKSRADNIARTETNAAMNFGAFSAYAAEGVSCIQWLCLLPSTEIRAFGVNQVARRKYDGSVLRLVLTDGVSPAIPGPTVTPNHPVLTARGWIEAQKLQIGDHLFGSLLSDDGMRGRQPDVDNVPTTLEELFESAALRGPTERMVGVVLDFDSEQIGLDREVEVVAVDGELRNRLDAEALQHFSKSTLLSTDVQLESLAKSCSAVQRLRVQNAALASASSSARGSQGGGAVNLPTNTSRLGAVSGDDSVQFELPANGLAACSESMADRLQGFPREIASYQLIAVEVIPWSGHVYDLSVSSGWFLGNSIVVHNSTSDPRTRPSHQGANGQVRPLGSAFDVGGTPMLMPGDPSAPAREVCRCLPYDSPVRFRQLRAITRRRYEGDLVRISLSCGDEFSATPNHPVLGTSGWSALGEVKEGDYLVGRCLGGEEAGTPDQDDPPSSIGEIFDSAASARSAERVEGTPLDFHGDGTYREIEVVAVDGPLRFYGEPATDEEVAEFGLALADRASASFGGLNRGVSFPRAAHVERADSARLVRSGGPATAILDPGSLSSNQAGRGGVSDRYSCGEKAGSYGSTSEAEAARETQLAFAGKVALYEVIEVHVEAFSGHVYNLDTGDGWFYGATLVQGNCRCTTVVASDADCARARGGSASAG